MTAWSAPRGWRAAIIAIGAGLLAALAQPPFGFWPGVFGYGLVLWLLDEIAPERPLRSTFFRGWLTGSAYFLLSTYWVGEAFLVDVQAHGWQAPFAVLFLACGLGLLWGAAGAGYRWLAYRGSAAPGAWRVLTFAGAFAVVEWLRGHILSGFPWDLPGETWRAGGPISQSAALIGAYGLSIVTLAVAGAPALLRWGRRPTRHEIGAGVAAAAVLLVMAVGGEVRLHMHIPAAKTPLRLRVVQADIEQSDKWSPEAFRAIFDTYTTLTAQPPTGAEPQVVLWPESAIPAQSEDYLAEGSWTRQALVGALRPGQILLVGAVRTEPSTTGERYFNTALAIRRDADGLTVLGHYDKHHLVPFGEYMPADAVMGAIGFKALVHVGEGFTEGAAPAPLAVPGLPSAQVLICYESLFPAYVANDRPRPSWIANLSNDAWFGRTSGPWQHLNLASYRAIEEGLPLIRATPTGVSAVVDANGRPLSRLGLGVKGVIDADLPTAAPSTPYRRLRDWPFWLIVVFGLALPFLAHNGLRRR